MSNTEKLTKVDITKVAIVGALEEEVAHIASALENVSHKKAASLDVSCGTLDSANGSKIEVAATVGGMGLVNAAATVQYLIDAYHPQVVIFSGIAGNLNKNLHTNDVVLGKTVKYLDTDMRLIGQWKPFASEFHSDDYLLNVASKVLTDMKIMHIAGTIASGGYFVDSPEKVAEVIAATQADAVEMEGAAVLHVAARNDVPALVVRAMSDNADTKYEEFHTFDISEYADTAAQITVNILRNL